MKIKHANKPLVHAVKLEDCEPGSCIKCRGKYYIVTADNFNITDCSKRGVNLQTGFWIDQNSGVEPVEAHVVVES